MHCTVLSCPNAHFHTVSLYQHAFLPLWSSRRALNNKRAFLYVATECLMKSKPRIFFSLLALCYLEIVLWTACLAANGGAIEGHKYLQRETGNLKAFTGVSTHTVDLVDELVLAICEHHTALEHLCLQQQFNAWSVIASSLLQQPHAQSLRAFPAVQGLPAPFTGVQAID